uniref:Uncharacterized protein n=1 Tax=Fagus sylvatica TaxID=28930 RepID=A0A2N9H9Z5_FAGSY
MPDTPKVVMPRVCRSSPKKASVPSYSSSTPHCHHLTGLTPRRRVTYSSPQSCTEPPNPPTHLDLEILSLAFTCTVPRCCHFNNSSQHRSCLIMLDLECDALVVEMFQTFFKTISANHPHDVFSAMETIMTMVIDESDNISLDLLNSLFARVRKENKIVSPISWNLGAKVITNCAAKLQPYLQ